MGAGCSPIPKAFLSTWCLGETQTAQESVLCCHLAFLLSCYVVVTIISFAEHTVLVTWTVHGHFAVLGCAGYCFLSPTPLEKSQEKSVRCCLALPSGGLKDVKGCASLKPTCPLPRALPPARVASCLESDSPRLLLASRALGGRRRSCSLRHQVQYSRPWSSHAVLTALIHPGLLCPSAAPYVEGAVPQNPASAPCSGQLPNSGCFPRACRTPVAPLPPSSFSCLFPAPQLLANRFPTHPHILSLPRPLPTVSRGSQVVLSPDQWLKEPGWHDLWVWVLLETHLPPEFASSGERTGLPESSLQGRATNLATQTVAPYPSLPTQRLTRVPLLLPVFTRRFSLRDPWGEPRPGPEEGSPCGRSPISGPGLEGLERRRSELSCSPLPLQRQEPADGGGRAGAHQFRSHLLCCPRGGGQGWGGSAGEY